MKKRIIDLTHTISSDMPVYPGTEKPHFTAANTIENDGFRETVLNMYSHTGTHTDSPAHLFADGRSLDSFDVTELCANAVVLDCTDMPQGSRIGLEKLMTLGEKLSEARFLVIRTGWEKFWNSEEYFGGFPCIDSAVAEYLVKNDFIGVGVDAISVDPVGEALDIHKILLGSGRFVIVENLCNLRMLGDEIFELYVMPLKFSNADGAPTRAIAVMQE